MTELIKLKYELKSILVQDIQECFTNLIKILDKNSKYYDEFIIHHSRYNDVSDNFNLNVISKSERDLTINKLRLAIVELINKLTHNDILQKDENSQLTKNNETNYIELNELIEEKLLLQNIIDNFPFKYSALRRLDIPVEENIYGIFQTAKHEIYVKAICLTITQTGGLYKKIEKALKVNQNLRLYFLLYNIKDSKVPELVEEYANLSKERMQMDINQFVVLTDKLNVKYNNRIQVKLYNSFPTSSIILADPKEQYGWGKFELYLYPHQIPDDKINLVLKNETDTEYFQDIYTSITNELKTEL